MTTARIVLAALALAGCTTTLAELRATPPVREASVVTSKPRAALAACAMDGMETSKQGGSDLVYRILDRTPTQTSLTGVSPAASGSTLFEATFTSRGDAISIETRADGPPGWGWRIRKIEREEFWPILARCAGTTIAVTPPLE